MFGLTNLGSVSALGSKWGGAAENPDLVLNGGFNDTSAWLLNPGVSISGGKLVYAATPNGVAAQQQNNNPLGTFEANTVYVVRLEVSDYVAGGVRINLFNMGPLSAIFGQSNGVHVIEVSTGGTMVGYIRLWAGGVSTLKIDNISIRKK